MSEYDNGFDRAQASYEARTDEDMYRDPEEDNEPEWDTVDEVDRAERAYERIRKRK